VLSFDFIDFSGRFFIHNVFFNALFSVFTFILPVFILFFLSNISPALPFWTLNHLL